MSLRFIKQARNLSGKRVLLRVDFNVPMNGKKIVDDARIRASVPTILHLLKKKARVIVVTHIGRPGGRFVASLRVDPIIERLSQLLNKNQEMKEIKKLKKLEIGNKEFLKTMNEIKNMRGGEMMMLENIRFYPGEEKNDPAFAKRLASVADVFVLDGFAVAHRSAASVSGVAKYLPSYAGLLLEKEMTGLNRAIKNPKKPFVVILGGAKTETKIPILKHLLPKADCVLLGGGIFNTYLAARGYDVGDSLVDRTHMKDILRLCGSKKVVQPIDIVVGKKNGRGAHVINIDSELRMKNVELGIYDIGPKTIQLYGQYMQKARTLVWNGAMGRFEVSAYRNGTLSVARMIARRSKNYGAFSVIGGGETLQAMDMTGKTESVDLASTGGGAMLEYLAGKKLPGIEALLK